MAKGKGGRGIAFFALLISVAALAIAIVAYRRTGAELKLRDRVETLQQALDNARRETANALDRLEELVRGSKETQR